MQHSLPFMGLRMQNLEGCWSGLQILQFPIWRNIHGMQTNEYIKWRPHLTPHKTERIHLLQTGTRHHSTYCTRGLVDSSPEGPQLPQVVYKTCQNKIWNKIYCDKIIFSIFYMEEICDWLWVLKSFLYAVHMLNSGAYFSPM